MFTINPNGTSDTFRAGGLSAHFASHNVNTFAGTITYQAANGPVTIPFTATVNTGGTTAGGTTAGGTTSGTTGGTTAGGTASIQGKTLLLSYQPSGGEKFQFTSATQALYEGVEASTYTYDTNTGHLHIVRAAGQTYDLVVAPGSSTGTTTVIYKEANGTPTQSAASYTLTG